MSFAQLFKSIVLFVAVTVGLGHNALVDAQSASEAATIVNEIAATISANAQVTVSLANSLGQSFSQFNGDLGGRVSEVLQQIRADASELAAANDKLNAILQQTQQTFSEAENNAASIFDGLRNLRADHD